MTILNDPSVNQLTPVLACDRRLSCWMYLRQEKLVYPGPMKVRSEADGH
jgi:hypothetical protein